MNQYKKINFQAFGPGILFAAFSIGVSHLVQSTRAGAMYGIVMILIVLFAHLVKYPAFKFAAEYSSITGFSILEGYRRQGKWSLYFFGAVTLMGGFFGVAALSLVTAGTIKTVMDIPYEATEIAIVFQIATAGLLIIGNYKWLERAAKVLLLMVSGLTILAAILVLPDINWSLGSPSSLLNITPASLFFMIAMIGYMPSALDASIWHSLWQCEKAKSSSSRFKLEDVRRDFHVGYFASIIVALCFLFLGAGLMHSRDIIVEEGALAFSSQLINLYTVVLGDWARPIISIGIVAIMFSTLLTALDAVPRSLSVLIRRLKSPEINQATSQEPAANVSYYSTMFILIVGASLLYGAFLDSIAKLVDMGATLAFLASPVLAFLNHRCRFANEVPEDQRPTLFMHWFGVMTIIAMILLAASFIYLRFFL